MSVPHPILPEAHAYKIITFSYDCSASDFFEHTLDLHLQKGSIVRRLRFIGPQNLTIENGFPQPTHGMEICDVRDAKLEHIKVSVRDFEASHGSISFDALDVLDLDQEET